MFNNILLTAAPGVDSVLTADGTGEIVPHEETISINTR